MREMVPLQQQLNFCAEIAQVNISMNYVHCYTSGKSGVLI